MANRLALSISLGLCATLMLTGCNSTKRALGLEKTVPDEFAVLNRGPLVMPPDYQLRPPVPGADRPQEIPAAEQARTALLGRAKLDALRARGASRGEVALLAHAGADIATPDVRQNIDREASSFAPEDRQLTQRLLADWKDETLGEGVAVDPVAESKRLDQAKAEGKKPNETPVPTIGKGASGGGFLGIF